MDPPASDRLRNNEWVRIAGSLSRGPQWQWQSYGGATATSVVGTPRVGPQASDPPAEPHSHDPPGRSGPGLPPPGVENQFLLVRFLLSPSGQSHQPRPAPFSLLFHPRCSCSAARCLLLAIVSGLQSAGRLSACSYRRCSFPRYSLWLW